MQSIQYFDSKNIKVPLECCYCNTAIGNKKFIIKKIVKKDQITQKNILEFPICDNCKKKYRNKLIFSYVGGVVVFSILIFILAVISVEINIAWLTLVLVVVLERAFQFVFGKYVIEPLRPAAVSVDGKFTFHNKEFRDRFEALNFPASWEEEND